MLMDRDTTLRSRHRAPNVFRGDYTFTNSKAAVMRFPFPFSTDSYKVDVNTEPNNRCGDAESLMALFDVDEHYHDEIAERAWVLQTDPSRYHVLPHMESAQWEALEMIMENLAKDFPEHFSFSKVGQECAWENRLLGLSHRFMLGDQGTLPCEPFEYITRQAQGDFVLIDQREDDLWIDGGMVTQSFSWSFDFVLGMNWAEWHGPIMGQKELDVIERGRRMTMVLPADRPLRRLNWVTLVKPRLDRSLEAMPEWEKDDLSLEAANVPNDLFFRVELQQLYRLPQSHAILFVLRNYMISFDEISRVPNWRVRLHRVLRDLDPNSDRYHLPGRAMGVEWLSQFDRGQATKPGRGLYSEDRSA
jgi:dimethylamine monooxygenase subunit A